MKIVALAGVLLLGLGVGGCQPGEGRLDPLRGQARRLQWEQGQLYQAGTMADAMAQVDSLLAAREDGGSVQIIGFARDSAVDGERILRQTTDLWERAGGPASGGRLAIMRYQPRFAVPDSTRAVWRAFSGTFLPPRTDGRTCVVAVPDAPVAGAGRPGLTGAWVESVLAPCLFFARFGPPGPAMADWLARTDHDGIRSVAWLVRGHAPIANEYWWLDDTAWGGTVSWRSAIAPLTALASGAASRMPPYEQGLPAVGCLGPRSALCERMLLDDVALPAPAPEGRSVVVRRLGVLPGPGATGVFGRGHWVSELIRLGGPERFAELWRSEQPIAAAYRKAYGADLAASAAAWSRSEWHQRRGRPAVLLGTTLDGASFAGSVAWIVLLLLLPVAGAIHRDAGG